MTYLLAAAIIEFGLVAALSAICHARGQIIAGLRDDLAALTARNETLLATALEAHNLALVDPAERAATRAGLVAERAQKRKKLGAMLRDLERQHAAPAGVAMTSEAAQ